jgi:uncharacterized membrane protein SpoIIM required for sporulation
MIEAAFIKENAVFWKQMESDTKSFKKKWSRKKLSKEDIDKFILLYNKIANDLAYSRTNFPSSETTVYLNKLMAQAHVIIYTSPKARFTEFLMFFVTGFPRLFRENIRFFWVSALIFLVPLLFSFTYSSINPQNALAFLPKDQAIIVNEGNKIDSNGGIEINGTFMSSYIVTNNIKACIYTFVLGLTLGIGTVFELIYNGVALGSLGGLLTNYNKALFFWSFILPHGVPELFAIMVSGAAGLMIAYALINPGKLSRKDALINTAKKASLLMVGCIPILTIAAIIEGNFTPITMEAPYTGKYLFAGAALVLLCLYLMIPGRKKAIHTHH